MRSWISISRKNKIVMYKLAPNTKLVLASASPRRKDLLESVGLEFEILPAQINEEGVDIKDGAALVRELASLKAKKVATLVSDDSWILAADTIVALDGKIYGKPSDPAQSSIMLHELSGKEHQVYGGYTLINRAKSVSETKVVCSKVSFYQLEPELIKAYVASGEPKDKAGAYGIQGLGQLLVREISGSYSNIVGLDLALVIRMFLQYGIIKLR